MEHGKGQEPETDALIRKDKDAQPEQIIENGHRLIQNTLDAFSHIIGPSPKSLELVPALYFYTEAGRHVRSLLYGILYWLLAGNDNDILTRKRLFSAHRASFEEVLLSNKDDIIKRLTRNIGSGPEITEQTARFYQRVLALLVEWRGDVHSDGFVKSYSDAIGAITSKRPQQTKADIEELRSRLFTAKQKSIVNLRTLFSSAARCGICGGMLDLEHGEVQHDHIKQASEGGPTSVANQRVVHPFCNNQRVAIERLRDGVDSVQLPIINELDVTSGVVQLSFIQDLGFS